ncbi:TIGR04219 family outer membrane beta-barrel protein [Natronospirillum operosum]|nr:TIGR04219 family outer membrane beta-barrel protein [Natronospirillum operosum]
MKKTMIVAATLATVVPGAQAAPFVDFEFGGGMTFPSLDGGQIGDDASLTGSGGQANLDLEAQNGFYLGGRIGIPVVPDLKLKYERLMLENDNVQTTPFEIDGDQYSGQGSALLDMSHLDTTLFYSLPDLAPGLDYYVDFGLNVRWLLGEFEFEDDTFGDVSQSFTGIPLPAGHLAGGVTLPVVDVELSGELNTLPLDGISHTDWNVKARWYAPLPLDWVGRLGIEGGYRNWSIDVDGEEFGLIDDDFKLEFETSGFFVGTAFTF